MKQKANPTREYTVILHPEEEGGYWAEVPALPGCYSQGDTVEKAMQNVQEAIECHLEALKADGKEIPIEKGFMIGKVEVAAA